MQASTKLKKKKKKKEKIISTSDKKAYPKIFYR